MKLPALYSLFAILATITNIATQYCFELLKSHLFVSISLGTLAGLLLKYILDKKYIFNYQTNSKKEDGKLFILYSSMGIITTAIYLAFEVCFDYFFDSLLMRYTGACLGLAIGYISKYTLDKKFVFKQPTN